MGNVISVLFLILMVVIGGIPSIVITASIPVLIAQKIYRKARYGVSLYA